ncbi:hypothetical protein ASZ90_001154 [hydrocarbon metagenome]|uniref:Uncharacterized protein n=1 Tax=hydrocarbon metagenome TaxID=938273 RepID=A0A0W8G7I3_9ZZZZ
MKYGLGFHASCPFGLPVRRKSPPPPTHGPPHGRPASALTGKQKPCPWDAMARRQPGRPRHGPVHGV